MGATSLAGLIIEQSNVREGLCSAQGHRTGERKLWGFWSIQQSKNCREVRRGVNIRGAYEARMKKEVFCKDQFGCSCIVGGMYHGVLVSFLLLGDELYV